MKFIVYNAIRTPDGTVLESFNRHDYKVHKDKVSNEVYMVDGGLSYLRRSQNRTPAEELVVYLDDDYDKVRSVPFWKSYGKDGELYPEGVRLSLKQMSDDHIRAILDTQQHVQGILRELFIKELDYRKE